MKVNWTQRRTGRATLLFAAVVAILAVLSPSVANAGSSASDAAPCSIVRLYRAPAGGQVYPYAPGYALGTDRWWDTKLSISTSGTDNYLAAFGVNLKPRTLVTYQYLNGTQFPPTNNAYVSSNGVMRDDNHDWPYNRLSVVRLGLAVYSFYQVYATYYDGCTLQQHVSFLGELEVLP